MPFMLPIDNQFHIDASQPTFFERWVCGTYIVTGVFPSDGRGLTVERMVQRIPLVYSESRLKKRALWPRGICGYYLIPLYVTESFDAEVIKWVHTNHPYRWAIWHVPVLYNSSDNSVEKNDRDRLHGSAFRPYLENNIRIALNAVAQKFGYGFPQKFNS